VISFYRLAFFFCCKSCKKYTHKKSKANNENEPAIHRAAADRDDESIRQTQQLLQEIKEHAETVWLYDEEEQKEGVSGVYFRDRKEQTLAVVRGMRRSTRRVQTDIQEIESDYCSDTDSSKGDPQDAFDSQQSMLDDILQHYQKTSTLEDFIVKIDKIIKSCRELEAKIDLIWNACLEGEKIRR
ncbi:hypothetical protein RFI_24375, partial [Reticulomyxa filosa]